MLEVKMQKVCDVLPLECINFTESLKLPPECCKRFDEMNTTASLNDGYKKKTSSFEAIMYNEIQFRPTYLNCSVDIWEADVHYVYVSFSHFVNVSTYIYLYVHIVLMHNPKCIIALY